MTFDQALGAWKAARIRDCETRHAYELAYARAITEATGGSAEVRKAQATLTAASELLVAELATIDATAAAHMVDYLKAGSPA